MHPRSPHAARRARLRWDVGSSKSSLSEVKTIAADAAGTNHERASPAYRGPLESETRIRIPLPPAESLRPSVPQQRTEHRAVSPQPWRTQSHRSRNCLTAYSVTHLSGRFLRLGKSIMGQPKRVVAPKDSWHYREVASKLRGIARQSPLPGTRHKILDFALRFEGIAEQVDRRSPTGCRPEDAC